MSISMLKRSLFTVSSRIFTGISPSSPAQAIKPVPPTPIDVKKVELGGTPWNSQWDQIIEKALPPEMLSSQVPRGVRQFCPRFYEMGTADKRAFWAYFFQALAGAEAGLNPNTSIRHSKPEGAIAMRSEGLLQLAYADQKRYGCDFNWQVDRALKANDPAKAILQPKNNLECGVKILVNQTIVQHKPLLSRSEYWSTLQPDGPSARVFAKQMTNPPAACGLPTSPRSTSRLRQSPCRTTRTGVKLPNSSACRVTGNPEQSWVTRRRCGADALRLQSLHVTTHAVWLTSASVYCTSPHWVRRQ
jgi:hypothetical protein